MMRLCRCLSQHNAALKLASQYQSPMVPSGAVGDFFTSRREACQWPKPEAAQL